MHEHNDAVAADGQPTGTHTNGNGRSNGNGDSHTAVEEVATHPTPELPGDVLRRIETGEAPDPMWYVGRTGPSVQDVLDAEGDELERLRRRQANGNGNGNGAPVSRRTRQPAPRPAGT